MLQTNEAYEYINCILLDNYSLIVKFSILDSIMEKDKKPIKNKPRKIRVKINNT